MTDCGELVSVVIPSYNYGRFVFQAVDSVLAQTYRSIEVIVVDDCSTDDTSRRMATYGHRVSYIRHEINKGLSATRNTGIRNATGEWIALLDADDLWHPEKLDIQLRAVRERPGAALIGSPPASSLAGRLSPNPQVRELTLRDFVVSSRAGVSGALIRRRSFESVGYFDETLESVEDRDMWLRLAARFLCLLVDSPCWWYRRHPVQMSQNAPRMFANYSRVLDKFFSMHPQHRDLYRLAMGFMYFDAAWSNFAAGHRAEALYRLAVSGFYRPLGLGDTELARLIRVKLALRMMVGAIPKTPASAQVSPCIWSGS